MIVRGRLSKFDHQKVGIVRVLYCKDTRSLLFRRGIINKMTGYGPSSYFADHYFLGWLNTK